MKINFRGADTVYDKLEKLAKGFVCCMTAAEIGESIFAYDFRDANHQRDFQRLVSRKFSALNKPTGLFEYVCTESTIQAENRYWARRLS